MKKIIAILLVFCMVLPFAACQQNPQTPGDSSNPSEDGESTLWQDSIGTKDFGGEEVVISVLDNYEYELFGAEDSKDTLDQLLFKRNRALQDRFNVELVSLPTQSTGIGDQQSHYDDVQRALSRNETDFDVVAMFAYQSGKLIKSGFYLDWRSDIPYCADSIKAGADWWPKGINDDCTIFGRQYVAVSDICITAIEMAWSIVFNKDMVADYNIVSQIGTLAGKQYESMYDVVDSGDWTLDIMYNALKNFFIPGTSDKEESGTYGMVLQGSTGVDAFAFSFGYHYIINDGINVPELWTPTGGTITTLETLRNFSASAGVYNAYGKGKTESDLATMFAERHTLFATMPLETLKGDIIHEMDDSFGILPYPKLNTQQKQYLSGTVDHYSVLSVPWTNFNTERVGAVIEAISAYNNLNVNDVYYEAIVTHKNTRDPESVRMINLIMEGRVYDLTTYHYNDLYIINNAGQEGALGLFFRHVLAFPTEDISSYWQSGLTHLQSDFEDLIDGYETAFGTLA